MSKNELKYVKVTQNNFDIAFNIQKEIWPHEPDYNNFLNKAKSCSDDNISFIVYLNDNPIGITGVFTEDIDNESIWLDWYGVLPQYRKNGLGKQILLDTINYCKNLGRYEYLRLDTTFWDGRPAIALYDKIMTFKEEYTAEDGDECNNWLIYTYSLHGKREPWNNRNLRLKEYYNKLTI